MVQWSNVHTNIKQADTHSITNGRGEWTKRTMTLQRRRRGRRRVSPLGRERRGTHKHKWRWRNLSSSFLFLVWKSSPEAKRLSGHLTLSAPSTVSFLLSQSSIINKQISFFFLGGIFSLQTYWWWPHGRRWAAFFILSASPELNFLLFGAVELNFSLG